VFLEGGGYRSSTQGLHAVHARTCCMGGAGAGAPPSACSCTTRVSRPPIRPSTALCAKALPVPRAAPVGVRASVGGSLQGSAHRGTLEVAQLVHMHARTHHPQHTHGLPCMLLRASVRSVRANMCAHPHTHASPHLASRLP